MDRAVFQEAVKKIIDMLGQGLDVLVHCSKGQKGQKRSAALVCYILGLCGVTIELSGRRKAVLEKIKA